MKNIFSLVFSIFLLASVGVSSKAYSYPQGWPPKWLDFPTDDYSRLLRTEDCEKAQKLSSLIALYNKIDKTSLSSLEERIHSLSEIIALIQDWKDSTNDKLLQKQLSSFLVVGRNKSWYLNELKEGYASGRFLFDYSKVKGELTFLPEEVDADQALFLQHEDRFNPDLVEYWGDFWFEYIDPCHRKLWSYQALWIKKQKENSEIAPFFLWLEEQNLSIDVPFVHYYTDMELSHCLTYQENGSVYFQESKQKVAFEKPLDYLFVISLEKQLYLTKGSSTIHHTSLTRGKPILAAGIIRFFQGEVQYISFESGHYVPTISKGKHILKCFADLNIPLKEEMLIGYFNDFGKQQVNLQIFLSHEIN